MPMLLPAPVDRIRRSLISDVVTGTAILAATGLTPLQLLIETRLARGQSLLAETDLEFGTIAERVGFDDPAYFSRQFTRRLGVSPSTFRQEQRRAPDTGSTPDIET